MSDPPRIRADVNRGLAWIGLAAGWVSALDILANVIILALWVSPREYGVAALAITLYPVLDLAADLGLASAVIQRDDHTDDKIATVFWLNLAMSVALFAALGLAGAPALAALHGEPMVASLLTAYGVKLVWQNTYQIPKALMRRQLRFKEVAGVRAIANVLEFAAKVGFAAAGAGIWCFVAGPLAREVGWAVGIQWCEPWRPRLALRLRAAAGWTWFGVRASASQILFHIYTNLDYQVVGYWFGPIATGYYRLAYDVVLEPCRILAHIVNQVAFPAYARLRRDRPALVAQFLSLTRLNLVVVLGFLAAVVVAADDLIGALWGARWLPAVPGVRVLAIVGALRAISFVIPPLLEGMGYPGRSLLYNAIASVVLPAAFAAGAAWFGDDLGYLSVAWAWVAGYPVAFAVLAAMALAALDLSAAVYARKIAGVFACAAAAMGAAAAARWLAGPLPPAARLAATVVALLVAYAGALAAWQGITPKSVAAALRDAP